VLPATHTSEHTPPQTMCLTRLDYCNALQYHTVLPANHTSEHTPPSPQTMYLTTAMHCRPLNA